MNDRDALRAAILEHPDDDTPRLVFADWLDEHEQPHWAALIRAEVERERLRADGSEAEALLAFLSDIEAQGGCAQIARRVRWDRAHPDAGRRHALGESLRPLRRRSAKVRNAGRPSGPRCGVVWDDATHRGFQASATVVDPERFARHSGAVMRWCPPLGLTLNYDANDHAAALGPTLRWARALELRHDPRALFASLCADPAGARDLTLRCSLPVLDDLFRGLAGCPGWAGLRSLDAPLSGVVGEPAEAFFAAPHLADLPTLRLVSDGWTPDTVGSLVSGRLRNLRELALRFGQLDDAAAERLAAAPALAGVRYLDLSHNRITGRGATALLASPVLRDLTVLELEGNPVRDLDRVALRAAPRGGLRALSLHGCRLHGDDVSALASSPRVSELLYLDLDYNGLGDSAVGRLVTDLPCAPAVVYLMGNDITARGARALAIWAGAPGLDQLHVCRNPLHSTGMAALAASARLAGLRHLCVTGGASAGRRALESRFKKRLEFPT